MATGIEESYSEMEADTLTIETSSAKSEAESEENYIVIHPISTFVDQLDSLVKDFRAKALKLEEEQEALLLRLMTLKEADMVTSDEHKDEWLTKIDSLTTSLLNVDVKICTVRDNHEHEALHKVNLMIDQIVSQAMRDLDRMKSTCYSLLDVCSWPRGCCVVELTGEQVEKSMTHEFQSTLVKCTWEDRNRIGRRLRGLMEYIESRQRTLHL